MLYKVTEQFEALAGLSNHKLPVPDRKQALAGLNGQAQSMPLTMSDIKAVMGGMAYVSKDQVCLPLENANVSEVKLMRRISLNHPDQEIIVAFPATGHLDDSDKANYRCGIPFAPGVFFSGCLGALTLEVSNVCSKLVLISLESSRNSMRLANASAAQNADYDNWQTTAIHRLFQFGQELGFNKLQIARSNGGPSENASSIGRQEQSIIERLAREKGWEILGQA